MKADKDDFLRKINDLKNRSESQGEKIPTIRVVRSGNKLILRTTGSETSMSHTLDCVGNSFSAANISYHTLARVLQDMEAQEIEMFEDGSNLLINDEEMMSQDIEDHIGFDQIPDEFNPVEESFTDNLLRIARFATSRTGIVIDQNKIVAATNFLAAIAYFKTNIIADQIVFPVSVVKRFTRRDPIVGVAWNMVGLEYTATRAVHFLTKSDAIISAPMQRSGFNGYKDEILPDEGWATVDRLELLDQVNQMIRHQNELADLGKNYVVRLNYGSCLEFMLDGQGYFVNFTGFDHTGEMGLDLAIFSMALETFAESRLHILMHDCKYEFSNGKELFLIGTGLRLRGAYGDL